ncbi:hypothetical protein K470DRAFT_271574 [Piedraia hortae CBS 480.64]|uniref:Uncharacterized protein n=1 Tax=Piedraia hortae CBS 480.64 TaxID=1314780 RepID=A0A6A7BWN5_9PEZI|nr:hypothetical protein K470DRAFT_271574 [Piedraia hortae CBS 480.64]
MSTIPAMTSKQAKAAYRARGCPTMTDKEKRQMERDMELSRREEVIKEQKRKAELRKKKAEAAVHAKEEAKAMVGSQRICDRYGHLSSQYHLGAFFGEKKRKNVADTSKPEEFKSKEPKSKEPKSAAPKAKEPKPDETAFDDSDLEDEVLLEVLDSAKRPKQAEDELPAPANEMPEPDVVKPKPLTKAEDELSSFIDEFESPSQIAREIAEEPPRMMLKDAISARLDEAKASVKSPDAPYEPDSSDLDDPDISSEDLLMLELKASKSSPGTSYARLRPDPGPEIGPHRYASNSLPQPNPLPRNSRIMAGPTQMSMQPPSDGASDTQPRSANNIQVKTLQSKSQENPKTKPTSTTLNKSTPPDAQTRDRVPAVNQAPRRVIFVPRNASRQPRSVRHNPPINQPPPEAVNGYTLSELESLIDEDPGV